MKLLLKSTHPQTDEVSSFTFDTDTWEAIGEQGTGSLGHYTSQGSRVLYVSPKPSKLLGRHRFVVYGSGYYAADTGGYNWGKKAREVDLETALHMMDAEHVARFSNHEELC